MQKKLTQILGIPIAATSYEDAVHWIIKATTEPRAKYVCLANVHMCMEAFDCGDFRKVVNNANLVVPDGMPLVWGLKALGQKHASQVRGSDLMLRVCEKAEKTNLNIGLYGGTSKSLEGLVEFLQKIFPTLKITFFCSPPFRELNHKEKKNYIERINAYRVKILFVGIGCPKQEKWMAEHQEKLSCVMIGVGAAFDFFSGQKKSAPRWIQKIGLEWMFRLSSDPKRLWKRYLKQNPRFVWHFFQQWIIKKNDKNKKKLRRKTLRSKKN